MILGLTVQLGSGSGRCRYKLVAQIRIRNKLAFRICNLDLLIRKKYLRIRNTACIVYNSRTKRCYKSANRKSANFYDLSANSKSANFYKILHSLKHDFCVLYKLDTICENK
jgi:hypothetical protein